MGGSDSEDLSYDVHSDDSSDDDDALFNAALAQTPSPNPARLLAKGVKKGAGSSPSPRAPPPTRSLGGTSAKLHAPANPPPVQMPASDAGGLRGAEQRAQSQRTEAKRAVYADSRPPPAASRTLPSSSSVALQEFRHSSPPRASGVSDHSLVFICVSAVQLSSGVC